MQTLNAVVKAKKVLVENVIELVAELVSTSEPFSFTPGQFVQFVIENKFRAYSIISLPHHLPELRFCIKYEDGGLGSEFVRALNVGDEIIMRGPLGNFVLKNTNAPVVCVANGVGVAPFYGMIPAVLAQNPEAQITLVFGVRTPADLFYQTTFESLAQQYQNLTFIPTLSRPDLDWPGHRGRVTAYLEDRYLEHESATFYLCGSLAMVQDARRLLLDKGHPVDRIKLEIFT